MRFSKEFLSVQVINTYQQSSQKKQQWLCVLSTDMSQISG